MKYIEKTIKIILSIVLIILFIPFFLFTNFDIFSLVSTIIFTSTSFFIYIYAVWSSLFENRKRRSKFFSDFLFLINNLFIFTIALLTKFNEKEAIAQGYMQKGLISQITNVWMPYFTFFYNFCFFTTVLIFIDNLIRNNRPLKWKSWFVITTISLICSVVCLLIWEDILFHLLSFAFVIMQSGLQFFYAVLLFFAIYLIYDKYKKNKLKKSQIQCNRLKKP